MNREQEEIEDLEDINDEDYLDKYTNEIAISLIFILIIIFMGAIIVFKRMGLL